MTKIDEIPIVVKNPSNSADSQTVKEMEALSAANGMADLSAPKRNVVMYERQLHSLNENVTRLRLKNEVLQEKNDSLQARVDGSQNLAEDLGALKRANFELFLDSVFSTIFMAIGGALISSFPLQAPLKSSIKLSDIPCLFAAGWVFILMGCF